VANNLVWTKNLEKAYRDLFTDKIDQLNSDIEDTDNSDNYESSDSDMDEVKNIRVLPISKYSGDALTLSEWLANYYRHAKCYGWTDALMIERLPLHLEGIALNICTRMTNAEKDTWEHVNETMKRKIIIGNPEQAQLRAFRTRARKSGENAIDYAYAIRTLADRALIGIPDQQQSNMILDQFLSGLNPKIRKQILITEPTNIDEALTKVMLYEQYDPQNQVIGLVDTDETTPAVLKGIQIYRRNNSNNSVSDNEQEPRNNYQNRDSRMQRNYDNHERQWDRNFQNRSTSNERFSRNSTPERRNFENNNKKFNNHYRNNSGYNNFNETKYNSYRNSSPQRNNFNRVQEQSGSRVQCFNCGKIGHLARNCRQRNSNREYGSRSNSMERSTYGQQVRDNVNFQGKVKCFECNKYGHFAKSCPTLRKSVFSYTKNNYKQQRREQSPFKNVSFSKNSPNINLTEQILRSNDINCYEQWDVEENNDKIRSGRFKNMYKNPNKKNIGVLYSSRKNRQNIIKDIYVKLDKEMDLQKHHDLIRKLADIKFKVNEIEPLIKILRHHRRADPIIRTILFSIFKRYSSKSIKSTKISEIIKCHIITYNKMNFYIELDKTATVSDLRKYILEIMQIPDNEHIIIRDDTELKIESEGYLLDVGYTLSDINVFNVHYEFNDLGNENLSDNEASLDDYYQKNTDLNKASNKMNMFTESDDSDSSSSEYKSESSSNSSNDDIAFSETPTKSDDSNIIDEQMDIRNLSAERNKNDEQENMIMEKARFLLTNKQATEAELSESLRKLEDVSIDHIDFPNIIPLLLNKAGEQTQYGETIKGILQRYGFLLRFVTKITKRIPLRIIITNKNNMIITMNVNPHSQVKAIRRHINNILDVENAIIILTIHGYQVDDDEHVIECGCYPEKENQITADIINDFEQYENEPEDEIFNDKWTINEENIWKSLIEEGNNSNKQATNSGNFNHEETSSHKIDNVIIESEIIDISNDIFDETIKCSKNRIATNYDSDNINYMCLIISELLIKRSIDKTKYLELRNDILKNTNHLQIDIELITYNMLSSVEKIVNNIKYNNLYNIVEITKLYNEIITKMTIKIISDSDIIKVITYIILIIEHLDTDKNNLKHNLYKLIKTTEHLIRTYVQQNDEWKELSIRLDHNQEMESDIKIQDKTSINNRVKPLIIDNEQWDYDHESWMEKFRRKLPSLKRSQLVTLIVMILTILIQVPTPANSLTAFDCSKLQLGDKKYSLRDTDSCPEAVPTYLKQSPPIIFNVYQESDFIKTIVKECIVRKSITLWNCGHQSWSSILVPTTPFEPIIINMHNCEDAFQTQRIRIEEGITISAKRGVVINERINRKGKIYADGHCDNQGSWTFNKIRHSNAIVVEDYQTELREYPVIFDENGVMVDRPYCLAKDLTCVTGQSTLVYRPPKAECRLTYLKSIQFYELKGFIFENGMKQPETKFSAPTKETDIPKKETPTVLVAIDPEDAMRFVLKGIITKCSTAVNITDYDGVYVSTEKITEAKVNIEKTDIKLQHYFNNKMNFLYHHGMMKLEKVYKETIINDCRLNREIVRTKLAIAITNPDSIAPLILEPGTFARVMGEVLYTYKCERVTVKIRDNRNRCTNELPVLYNNKPAYVNPITRIINTDIHSIKYINCSNYMSPMYEIQSGTWITLPSRQIVPSPQHMEFVELIYNEKFKPLETISSNGMYSSKDIEAARRFIMFPQKRERVLTEMVYTLQGNAPGGTNFELLLSPEHFARATHNTMKRIWGKFLIFGQMFAGLMGVYCIFICLKIILSQVLSTYHIYKIGGITWKLILGCFPFLAKYVLFHHQYDIIKTMKKEQEEHPEIQPIYDPKNTNHRQFTNKIPLRYMSKPEAPPFYNTAYNCDIEEQRPVQKPTFVAKYVEPTKTFTSYIIDNVICENKEFKPLYPTKQVEQIRREEIIREYKRQNGLLVILGPENISPCTKIKINNKIINTIWDTGSPITVIHKECLTDKQLDACEIETQNFFSITGEALKIHGTIWSEIKIDQKQIFSKINILEEGLCNCIIGMNVITEIESQGLNWSLQNYDKIRIEIKIIVPEKMVRKKFNKNVFINKLKHKKPNKTVRFCLPKKYTPSIECSNNNYTKSEVLIINRNDALKPYIIIKINDKRINALIDTGAATTLIHKRCCSLGQLQKLQYHEPNIKSITGHTLIILGNLVCKFEILGKIINHEAKIINDYDYDCILGMDLLSRLKGVKIDLGSGTLIHDEGAAIKGYDVQISEETWLPPLSETLIRGTVNKMHEGEVLFEPNEFFSWKSDIPMSLAICHIEINEIPIRLLNPSTEEKTIYMGTRIGTISPIKKIRKLTPNTTKSYEEITLENSNIDNGQKQQLKQLLKKYQKVVAKHEFDLGQTSIIKHSIPMTNEAPIKQRPYRIPYSLQDTVKQQVKEMAEHNIIRESTSPWTSPVVMVKKKDGKMRFCIDYRKLNSMTRKDTFPLPRIDEMLDKLSNATIFTTLDLQSGYWQIEVEEIDKPKTAFSTGNDLWEFNVLPFGLTGAPATFQRCMNFILMDATHAMVYIDDIIIFSKSFDEHLLDLTDVFRRLEVAGLKVKPTKCEFAQKSVTFLGHVVSADGIRPDPTNTEKIKNFPVPKNVKGIQQFLGLAGYYRKFIMNFASIATPLNQLIKKTETFNWGTEQQIAFEILRNKLMNPPILRYPDLTKPFMLMTDASGYALGAVLGQKDDLNNKTKDHVIAYASRALKTHEKNYSTIEKEALAIVFAIKHFRHYVFGQKIKLYTDHKPLIWLMTHKDTSGRLIRWALQLQEYDIEFNYREGKANANADSLSRIGNDDDIHNNDQSILSIIHKTPKGIEEMEVAQKLDTNINEIKKWLKGSKPPNEMANHWKRNKNKYIISNDLLYFMNIDKNRPDALVIPEQFRTGILLQYHDGALGGHLSAKKTLENIRRKYYWPEIETNVKKWCKQCKICASRRDTGKRPKVPLQPMPIASAPMEQTAMDVMGPLPLTEQGNKYILVFCDYFTRWPEAFPMPNQKAETIAQIFVEEIICRYGVPKKLLTDRGTNFLSELMESISKIFKITRIYTSPYHPQTDGLVERFNQTLEKMISCYINANQTDWDVHIPSCLFAYRNTKHPSTGETPFYLMYLRESNMPSDIQWLTTSKYLEVPDYKTIMMDRLHTAWDRAGLKMKYVQEGMKANYDKTAKPHSFNIGDKVLVRIPYAKKGLTPKFERPFRGPYEILRTTPVNLKVKSLCSKRSEPIIVHANRCKIAPEEPEKPRYCLRPRNKQKETTSKTDLNIPAITKSPANKKGINSFISLLLTILIFLVMLPNVLTQTVRAPLTDLNIKIGGNKIEIQRRSKNDLGIEIYCTSKIEYRKVTLLPNQENAVCDDLKFDQEILLQIMQTIVTDESRGLTKVISENIYVHTQKEDKNERLLEVLSVTTKFLKRKPVPEVMTNSNVTIFIGTNDITFFTRREPNELTIKISCRSPHGFNQQHIIINQAHVDCDNLDTNTLYEVTIERTSQIYGPKQFKITNVKSSGIIYIRTLQGSIKTTINEPYFTTPTTKNITTVISESTSTLTDIEDLDETKPPFIELTNSRDILLYIFGTLIGISALLAIIGTIYECILGNRRRRRLRQDFKKQFAPPPSFNPDLLNSNFNWEWDPELINSHDHHPLAIEYNLENERNNGNSMHTFKCTPYDNPAGPSTSCATFV